MTNGNAIVIFQCIYNFSKLMKSYITFIFGSYHSRQIQIIIMFFIIYRNRTMLWKHHLYQRISLRRWSIPILIPVAVMHSVARNNRKHTLHTIELQRFCIQSRTLYVRTYAHHSNFHLCANATVSEWSMKRCDAADLSNRWIP